MNTRLPEHYRSLLCGSAVPSSVLLGLLPEDSEPPSVTVALSRLGEVGESVVAGERDVEHARWQLEVRPRGADAQVYTVWLQPGEPLEHRHLEWAKLGAEEVEAAERSRWTVGVAVRFHTALRDFHDQLKVLAAVAPQQVLALDPGAAWPRSSTWIHDAARCSVPPAPDSLFAVHAVSEDATGTAWLHTHGLLRCGCAELEVIDVPLESVAPMCTLLNAVAGLCIEQGMPGVGRPFAVGAGLELVWLPWEARSGRRPLGWERDEDHARPSAILFAPRRRLLGLLQGVQSPLALLPILEADPILYVSHRETERMALVARERLVRFQDLHQRYGATADWLFLVKLGYPVDDPEQEDDREHLWFEVRSFAGDHVEAVLLNEPVEIAAMREGELGRHSLALLSDWAVACGHGRFDPDTVGDLERILGGPPRKDDRL